MPNFFEPLEQRKLLAITSGFPIAIGNAGISWGREVAQVPGGDVIVAGAFEGTVLFNPKGGNAITLTSVGQTDLFFARYTNSGALVWAKRFGGPKGKVEYKNSSKKPVDALIHPERGGDQFVNPVGPDPANAGEYAGGIAVAPDGNIYFTGGFRGNATFGGSNSTGATILSTYRNYPDVFVIKLDGASGDLIWAEQFGGEFTDIGNSIALDPSGNPYVCGMFARTADFDPRPNRTYNITALGRADAFVMRLTADGALVWVGQMGSDDVEYPHVDSANDIAVDANGNAYIIGEFAGTADFNPRPGNQNPLYIPSAGETDIFTALLSHRGKLVWVKTQGGDHYDGGRSITLVGSPTSPNVVTASYFERTIDADPGPANVPLTAAPEKDGDKPYATDVLITRLNNKGTLHWVKQIGGGYFETIGRMTVDADDNIYLTGGFENAVDFNPGPAEFILTSVPLERTNDDRNEDNGERDYSYDGYFTSLDINGGFRFATQFGGTEDEFSTGLSRNSVFSSTFFDDFYMTGRFSGTTNLSPLPTEIDAVSPGKESIFVSLFDTTGNLT